MNHSSFLLATFCSPVVPRGETVALSVDSALLERQNSSAGTEVLRKLNTFTCGCKACATRVWNVRITEDGHLL